MFVYEFKSNDCLITKIVISGLHLTIYTKKPNSQELNGLIKEFNLKSPISADHPKHVFCHNNYIHFSAQGDSIPHKHLKFNSINSIIEIPNQVTRMIHFLIKIQHDPSQREIEFSEFLYRLNQERLSYGHTEFPSHVQEALDNYNTTSPYIDPLECEDFLNSLNSYYNQKFNVIQNALVQYAEKFLSDNWNVVYRDQLFNDDASVEQEKSTVSYYRSMLDLRNILLKLNIRQNDYNLHYDAVNCIDKLRKNEHFNKLQPSSSVISDIENCLTKKIYTLIIRSAATFAIMEIGLVTLILACITENKPSYANLTTAIICGIGTAYLAKPVYVTVKQTFFDYLIPEDSHKPNSKGLNLHIQTQREETDIISIEPMFNLR